MHELKNLRIKVIFKDLIKNHVVKINIVVPVIMEKKEKFPTLPSLIWMIDIAKNSCS